MNARTVSEFSSRAFDPPWIQFDRIDLPKPVLVHIDHMAVIRARLNEHMQTILSRISFDRALLRQMRRFHPRRASHPPPRIFAGRGDLLVPMKQPAVSKSLSQVRRHFRLETP